MTKSQYSYPPDEFDVRGPEGAPVGVHREPRSGWSSIWPFLLVAVIFAGLAVGVVSFLSGNGGSDDPPTASDETVTETTDGEDGLDDDGDLDEGTDDADGGDADADGGDGEAADEGDGNGEGGDGADAGTMPGDAAAANLAARVVVYNDGAGSGQAGSAKTVLETRGSFTDVGADDAPNAPVTLAGVYTETTVLYGSDRADTATAVAEAIGAAPENVQESSDVTNHPTDAVWVVLKTPVG